MPTATRKRVAKKKVARVAVVHQKPTAIHATPMEAAKFLSVSKWAIYRAIHSGEIEYVEAFGQYRILWSVLLKMSPNAFAS